MKTLALTTALIAGLTAPAFANNFSIVDADRDGQDRLVYDLPENNVALSTANSLNPVASAIAADIVANGDEFERSTGRGVTPTVYVTDGEYNPEDFRSGSNS
ncbi:hypothetical protein [Actibacterium ureilyticum]|uniref:hypothetical protein n=1 Tax=Actibacterium ureilyticum TaxID=1590614 RepID=UPI000BAADF71|nr:hypothetical protein [Actibacterium ureilyticum]